MKSSRQISAEILADWLGTGDFPDRAVGRVTTDRGFVTELVYGSIRRKAALEWIINKFVSREQDWSIQACLMIGVYQLIFMENVEEYASINESVEAVKSINPHAAGFANGVLRNCQRQSAAIKADLLKQPVEILESHPSVLTRRWKRNFGEDKCAELCKFNNTRPDTIVVPNILQSTCSDYLARLLAEGIEAVPHPLFPDLCITLPRGIAPTSLPGFKDGAFSIQDPATLHSIRLLDPQPDENILDACAAPGGKTMIIAQRTSGTGTVTAMDLHKDRLKKLNDNVKRMQLKNIRIRQGDASSVKDLKDSADGKKYDKILLDVPCTNTGVLRRRPDARWRFSRKRMKELAIIQKSMLNSASQFLAPGGTLVYSTCSLEPEEGERLVESWLEANTEFKLKEKISTWPPDSGTDGVFAASLHR